MPIIDDFYHTHDDELSTRFNNNFANSIDGRIIDTNGNLWFICKPIEVIDFVALLEKHLGHPMGRILHNSATDAVENILAPLKQKKFGLFAKKKRRRFIRRLWTTYGWGTYDFESNILRTAVQSSIVSGFYLAFVEYFHDARFKIQWQQQTDNVICCNLSSLNRDMNLPQAIQRIPWQHDTVSSGIRDKKLLEKHDLGWSIDGHQCFILPCEFVNRAIFNCGGLSIPNLSRIKVYWVLNNFDATIEKSLVCFLQAFKELFISTEAYVFLTESNNWTSVINTNMNPYGLGSVKHNRTTDDIDYFTVQLESNAPLVIGRIAGLWERANGKQPLCQVTLESDFIELKIQSLLEYNRDIKAEH